MKRLYQCKDCYKKSIYPYRFIGTIKCDHCESINMEFLRNICPICKKALKKKYEGWVCSNFKCELDGFKNGRGWCYLIPKDIFKEFVDIKWKNKITEYQNKENWLKIKKEVLRRDKYTCFFCGRKDSLHVHHILPQSDTPELNFDKENLVVLCENCHFKIHSEDKYAWRSK